MLSVWMQLLVLAQAACPYVVVGTDPNPTTATTSADASPLPARALPLDACLDIDAHFKWLHKSDNTEAAADAEGAGGHADTTNHSTAPTTTAATNSVDAFLRATQAWPVCAASCLAASLPCVGFKATLIGTSSLACRQLFRGPGTARPCKMSVIGDASTVCGPQCSAFLRLPTHTFLWSFHFLKYWESCPN